MDNENDEKEGSRESGPGGGGSGVRVRVNLLPRKGRLGHPSEMAEVKRGSSLRHMWTQAGRGP